METITLGEFKPKQAEIVKLAEKHEHLQEIEIKDSNDLKEVHEAEMEFKEIRLGVEKTCKSYTSQFDQAKKDAWEMRDELLDPIREKEKNLKEKKVAYKEKQEQIKQDKLNEKRKALQNRVDHLGTFNYSHENLIELSEMSEEDYESLCESRKGIFDLDQKEKQEAEQKRLHEEEKNAVMSGIMRCTTMNELDLIKKQIDENGLGFEIYENDFNNKKSMIEHEAEKKKFNEEKEAQQKKVDDENQKIQDEKDKIKNQELEKQRKIDEDKKIEEAKIQGKKDAEAELERKRLANEDKKRKEDEEKDQKKKEDEEKLAKKKKYQAFLVENGITQELINSGNVIMETNEETKERNFYKKIGTFKF